MWLTLSPGAGAYVSVASSRFRRHDVEAVRSLSHRARGEATIAEMPLWLGAATAIEAWVAWKDTRYEDVLRLAHEALDILGALEFAAVTWPTNYKPACLWPLVSIHLASGHIGDAVEAGCQLLDSSSVRPAAEVGDLLRSAISAWDGGDEVSAANSLRLAVAPASRLGWC